MQNNLEELDGKDSAQKTQRESGSQGLILGVLGFSTLILLIRALKKIFTDSYTPPIIIKGGSFRIGINIGYLEYDETGSQQDHDLLDPKYSSHERYKKTTYGIHRVVVEKDGEPYRCHKFGKDNDLGHCIIKFFFGSPPSDDSYPDILVTGENLRVVSKQELYQIAFNDPRRLPGYYTNFASGDNLSAIIFRRKKDSNGRPSDPEKIDTVIFDNNTKLGFNYDPSEYPDCPYT